MAKTKALEPVEELARWFHDAYNAVLLAQVSTKTQTWDELAPGTRENYRKVASMMLDRPPPLLRKWVLEREEGRDE